MKSIKFVLYIGLMLIMAYFTRNYQSQEKNRDFEKVEGKFNHEILEILFIDISQISSPQRDIGVSFKI